VWLLGTLRAAALYQAAIGLLLLLPRDSCTGTRQMSCTTPRYTTTPLVDMAHGSAQGIQPYPKALLALEDNNI